MVDLTLPAPSELADCRHVISNGVVDHAWDAPGGEPRIYPIIPARRDVLR